MVAVTLTVHDTATSTALARLAAASEDMAPLMDAIGGAMVDSTVERFVAERDPDGQPWPPSIRARLTGGQTLTDRGHLRDSVSHQSDATSVRWGSALISAAVHQLGAVIRPQRARALVFQIPGLGIVSRRSVTIPARPFLGYSADDRATVGDLVADWVDAAWTGGGA